MTKRIYSLWFISEDYENNAEFVTPETRTRYLREGKKLLKSQSEVGKAAVLIDIAWKMEEKVPKALGAEFLHNDRVRPSRMSTYIERRLRQIGLDEGGLPRGIRSLADRGRAIDAAEKAFAKKKPVKKKKRAATSPTSTTVGSVLDRIKAKKTLAPCNPDFARGMQVTFTPGARFALRGAESRNAVHRFVQCDWGDVSRGETRHNNRLSVRRRGPGSIRGVYQSRDGREFWIVYDPLAHVAVLLLPEEN